MWSPVYSRGGSVYDVEGRRHALAAEHIDVETGRVIQIVHLMRLYWIERELDDGRFKNFAHDEQPNRMEIKLHYGDTEALFRAMDIIVEWVFVHAQAPWSLRVGKCGGGWYDIRFSFEDGADAVHFTLMWKNRQP